MDNKQISIFANTLRDKLREEVVLKSLKLGISENKISDAVVNGDNLIIDGNVFNKDIKKQREQYVGKIKAHGFNSIIDEITYTWFNRFVALKFTSENGSIPIKVFSSSVNGRAEPDLLTNCLDIKFMNLDQKKLIELKTSGDDEVLYKYLVLSLCNHLNDIMPFLFEKIADYTELMFPEKLLRTDSILVDINTIISSDDWKEVEIIGWLYQSYIANEKQKLIESKKKYTEKQIDKVTQLFTPKWIVKYMVQNALGRYWLEAHHDSEIEKTFDFYLKSRDPDNEDKLKGHINKDIKVEEIRFIDPAMGSGHILVYAFEVLFNIYKSQGYVESDIAELILNKNLYGLDIDDRAGQLAQFALLMKARQYDSKLFTKKIRLNALPMQESNMITDDTIKIFAENDYTKVKQFFDQFIDAKIYGSIIKVQDFDKEYYRNKFEQFKKSGKLAVHTHSDLIEQILHQAEILSQEYDVSVANPPYLNSSRMPDELKKFVKDNYPNTKSDLFSVFIQLLLERTKKNGQVGMVTPFVWMFIKTYEWLREHIVKDKNISSLIQLEYNAFPAACVPACTFTIRNAKSNASGEYIKLSDFRGAENQPIKTLEAIKDDTVKYRYTEESQNFSKIPGSPIGYWVTNLIREIFQKNKKIEDFSELKVGLQTGDNNQFVRSWFEVKINQIGFGSNSRETFCKSELKWAPYNKGGNYRKWYGNQELVVNWNNDGNEIRHFFNKGKCLASRPQNMNFYFREGLTWSSLTSAKFSIRYSPMGFIFDTKGPSLFTKLDIISYLVAYLNSKVLEHLIKIISPTIDYNPGQLANIPIQEISDTIILEKIETLAQENIDISKEEWGSRETSWDFKVNELIKYKDDSNKLDVAFKNYCEHWKEKFFKLHENEEELNQLFIDIYDLNDELDNKVPLSEITILKDEVKERKENELVFKKEVIVKQFLSYVVGCMFGRYNPEQEGLILANQGETIDDFKLESKFKPDEDNIIPITDRDYFPDDIVGNVKIFLKTYFGENNITENLDFIASGLKGSGSPEEKLRRYFLKDFFKDHYKTYKKKPIYWLFTSGKEQGFNVLIYMHRYNKEVLAKIRTDYLLKLQDKILTRIDLTKEDSRDKDTLKRQSMEIKQYDELLNHEAIKYVDIYLDDGVTVNHAKFKGLLEKI
jgi:type II restriction/modification system DNA methylase subunit YeeA